MLTILITDDEREEREGIAFLIDELGFELNTVFAANGKEALEYLKDHEVDILFTDIRMPILDGLELSRLAREIKPDLKIIIYSGYSEFAYAKTAINLGVSDYILKPINIQEFEKTIHHAMEDIQNERKTQKLISEAEIFAKKHLLYNVINSPVFYSNNTAKMKEVFSVPYTKLFLLEFENNFFDMIDFDFEETLSEFLPVPIDYLNLNMHQCVLLFTENEADMNCSFYETAVRIHDWISETLGYNCYLALSSSLADNSHLSEVFAELEHLIEYRFFIPDTCIFEEGHLLSNYLTTQYTDAQLLENIEKDIKTRNFIELKLHMELFFQKYQNNLEYSQLYIKFIFSTLYKNIITEFDNLSELELNHSIDKLYRSTDLQEMKKLIYNTISKLEESTANNDHSQHDIELVKDYIEKHYGEDLNLVSLAEKVYLSPTYLCTRFKQATGFGINKYIKTVRMKKAEEMLINTNIKVIDICTKVGFHNLSYFCQNFREYAGETPEKYRKRNFSLNQTQENS